MNHFHYTIILASVALLLIGTWQIPTLPLSFGNDYGKRALSIAYTYLDANPHTIESEITGPIEGVMNRIGGIEEIYSEIKYGRGATRITLDKKADVDLLRFQIVQGLRQVYPSLPDGVPFPQIIINDPNKEELDPTLMSYSLIGSMSPINLSNYCRDILIPSLADVEGVYEVIIGGEENIEWHAKLDQNKTQSLGLSINDVTGKLSEVARSQNLSTVNVGNYQYYSRLKGLQMEDVMSLRLDVDSTGSQIALSDIISAKKGVRPPDRYYRINGNQSLTLNIIPESNANHISTAEGVRRKVAQLSEVLPLGMDLIKSYDSTKYVTTELEKIGQRTLWSITVLILFIFIVYRRKSYLLIMIFALLTNLSISVLLYKWFEVTINLYALAAITVSLGLILDNIIVVTHHYERLGNLSISRALVTICLTTLLSLGVIFFLPDQLQWELQDFAKVLSINLGVSVVVALLLVPAIIHQFKIGQRLNHLKVNPSIWLTSLNLKYKAVIIKLRRYQKLIIVGMILLFGIPVFWLPASIDGIQWYNQSLGSDLYQDRLKPYVNQILGGTLRLFVYNTYEGSQFRSPDETVLYVNASMPQGSTLDQMNQLVTRVEVYLKNYDDQIETFITEVRGGEYATMKISFPQDGDDNFPSVLKNRLQSLAIDQSGVDWSIYGVGRGFSSSGGASLPQFQILITGYNQEDLDEYSDQLATILEEHHRVEQVNRNANINLWEKDRDEFLLELDAHLLASNDLTKIDVFNVIRQYNRRSDIVMRTETNVPIRLKNSRSELGELWDIENAQHIIKEETPLLLNQVGGIKKRKVSNNIHKKNQQYLRLLEFEYTGSRKFGQAHLDDTFEKFIPQLALGYKVEQKSYTFWGQQEEKQYGLIVLVIIAIFFVSAIHFESLKAALLVISLIPMSWIGVFLTFYFFDFPFDQGGYTSFLLLSGLVINSLILILSDYYNLIKLYPNRIHIDLYLRAFRGKITPITLTIISTAVGLIPFTLHGSDEVFWFSLAVGTLGGLVFSFLVLLFVMPVFIKRV
jgi:multidrug efflux pump subunit AcrB